MSSADTRTGHTSPPSVKRTAATTSQVAYASDTDLAVTELFRANYRSLVRMSYRLVRDVETAEDTVQDAIVGMHTAWRRLRNPDKALAYLRRSVVNQSRSVLRHRAVVDKHVLPVLPDAPSAEHDAMLKLAAAEVIEALGKLPRRQREALVLRYYADLSEAETASAMGISRGAVKSHTSRGLAAVRAVLMGSPRRR